MISTDFTDWLSQTELINIYTLSIVNSEHEPKMDMTSYLFEKLRFGHKGAVNVMAHQTLIHGQIIS